MDAAMGLMRRIPPKHTETALSALLSLMPHHSSDLLSQVDQPLQVMCDVDCGKEFILCEYNRDADSYRSPWSNKYHPPLEDGSLPSLELRNLEIEANDIFAIYRDQYYEGGISSVYVWEDDNDGFVACFLIKKDGSKTEQGCRGYLEEGAWDAIHVIEGKPPDWQDFVGIITLLVINSTISFIEENNAGNAAAALMARLAPKAKVKLSGSISSQYLTALLMTAPFALGDVEIEIIDKLIPVPYVDMTLKLMSALESMWSTVVTEIGFWSTEVKSTSLLGMLLLKEMLLVPATSSQVQLLPVGLSQL